jgi:hypothetical protein
LYPVRHASNSSPRPIDPEIVDDGAGSRVAESRLHAFREPAALLRNREMNAVARAFADQLGDVLDDGERLVGRGHLGEHAVREVLLAASGYPDDADVLAFVHASAT